MVFIYKFGSAFARRYLNIEELFWAVTIDLSCIDDLEKALYIGIYGLIV